MAEEQKDGNGGALTVGELRSLITETVKGLLPGSDTKDEKTDTKNETKDTDSGTGNSIAAAVAREVERIRRKEEREQRDKQVDDDLKVLKERVVEKPPVERGRLHKIMGWGE